jgi:tetraacyldisaccharide 4'-kinase
MMAWLLSPIALIWGLVAGRRMARSGECLSAPVICIGNFVVGGAGKTPVALAVAEWLSQQGHRPAFLTRGHGGSLGASPVAVDAARHGAAQVGDEPLLLARRASTFVTRDRVAGARAALEAGADVIVMDDGLQNPALAKRLTIAVVDAGVGAGNGLCLPAGPLRAPLDLQWSLVDAVVLVSAGAAGEAVARAALDRGKPVFRARLMPDAEAAAGLAGRKTLAFAGIGRPEKFFETLADIGADIVASVTFPDHHPYTRSDIKGLLARAKELGAIAVTTEKDAVRIADVGNIQTLPVRVVFDDPAGFAALIGSALAPKA